MLTSMSSIEKYLMYTLLLVGCFAVSIGWTQETDNTGIIEAAIRHQNLGLAYLEESQPSKAVGEFTALIELLPDEAIGYGNLAVAHLRLQQADAAEEAVKRGIAVAPMDSQLHFILSEVYQLQDGKTDLAIEAMKEAVRLDPDELEFRYKLVRHYLGQRNDPEAQREAVQHLRELHARSPVNVVVLLKLTQGLIEQGQLEAAAELCQELMILLGDTDAEKLQYLTQGIAAIAQKDLKLASRNIHIFENLHRASPRYQQGIGELVTDILGHPIETFSPGFRARIIAKESPPIDVEFVDVTEALGLSNVKALLPLRIPTAVSFVNSDNDGKLDLYISGSDFVGLYQNAERKVQFVLYRNMGEQFDSVTVLERELEPEELTLHVAVADMNKDGIQDFLLETAKGTLYFSETTEDSEEAAPVVLYEQPVTEMGVLHPVDYDHDSDLDLFTTRAIMYRNNGDETFTDVTEQTFVNPAQQSAPAEALSADFDDDGDIDIFITHRET